MPIYYFHLRDGVDILLDEEGRNITDPVEIASAALREARSIISGDALEGYIRLDLRIDVEDDAMSVVHSLAFKNAVKIILPDASNEVEG